MHTQQACNKDTILLSDVKLTAYMAFRYIIPSLCIQYILYNTVKMICGTAHVKRHYLRYLLKVDDGALPLCLFIIALCEDMLILILCLDQAYGDNNSMYIILNVY